MREHNKNNHMVPWVLTLNYRAKTKQRVLIKSRGWYTSSPALPWPPGRRAGLLQFHCATTIKQLDWFRWAVTGMVRESSTLETEQWSLSWKSYGDSKSYFVCFHICSFPWNLVRESRSPLDQWPPPGFFENDVYILLVGENQKGHGLIKDSLNKPVQTSGYSPMIFEGVKHRVNMGLSHRSITYCLLPGANYLSNRVIFCRMGKIV